MGDSKDWFDELSEEQQKDVLEGLAEADRGEGVPHATVMKMFRRYFEDQEDTALLKAMAEVEDEPRATPEEVADFMKWLNSVK